MNKTLLYKLSKSLIPCLLITLAIGFTYAFSLFAPHIALAVGVSLKVVQFSFCLNIFFLGIGAAIFGKLIEHKIKTAAILSTSLMFIGLLLTGLGVITANIWMVYVGFGTLAGISEGIGYICPVLNNILWFGKGKFKGVVAALSIISFGLGSTLCSVLFGWLMPILGIGYIFFAYAAIYLLMMTVGCILIDKPKYIKTKKSKDDFSYIELIKDRYARRSWMYMFLNISMGLILIGSCASILAEISIAPATIIVIMMLCGIFNGAGRLVFPLMSDFMKNRGNILLIALAIEISLIGVSAFCYSIIPLAIIVINATYGCFFAMLPSILSDHYGNRNLSIRHSAILSSWGFASLFAYLCTYLIATFCSGYWIVTIVLTVFYTINVFIVKSIIKKGNN